MIGRGWGKWLLLCSLSVGAVYGADPSGGYRLAGVLSTGENRVGFLELPQGGQALIRLGSMVNGGKVVEFSAQQLRIAFPDRTIELTLTGAAAGSVAAPLTAKAAPAEVKAVPVALQKPKHYINNPKPIVMPAFTPSEAAVLSFNEHGPPPLPAGIDPAHYVAEVIAPTVALPAGATITYVNGQAVTSVAQAANALYAASELVGQAIVDVDTPTGRMHLYVATPPPGAIR
jgi:hypothetical protein